MTVASGRGDASSRRLNYRVAPGPHVTAALICERAIEEKDGTLTLARVIDKLTFQQPPEQGDTVVMLAPTTLAVVLALKNGRAGREYKVELSVVAPNGEVRRHSPRPVYVGGAHNGLNLIAQILFSAQQEGTYNFDFLLDGKFIARAPLLIERQAVAGEAAPATPPARTSQ